MPRPRKGVSRSLQATHLKYLGVTAVTTKLYLHAVHEFFKWRRTDGHLFCARHGKLDQQLAEYINYLHARGDPMYKAANALSGMKKFMPQTRRCLEVSAAYYGNWSKVTKECVLFRWLRSGPRRLLHTRI